jgi:hypothetical protein
MHAVFRAPPLALGLKLFASIAVAQAPDLPPIFAPRSSSSANSGPITETTPRAVPAISDRMRKQIGERILADVAVFEAPVAAPAAAPTETITAPAAGSDGPFQMSRFYVKALPLRREDVEPRPVRLLHFAPIDRPERRTQGHTATLWNSLDGTRLFNLNILNGAGKGMDHGRDFTRVEFEFKIRF